MSFFPLFWDRCHSNAAYTPVRTRQSLTNILQTFTNALAMFTRLPRLGSRSQPTDDFVCVLAFR